MDSDDYVKRAKNPKKSNFTSSEITALLREFSTRRDILLARQKTFRVNKAKRKAWSEVTRAVNTVSPVGRSVPEVKVKWAKLAKEAKGQLREKQPPPDGASRAAKKPRLDLDLIRRMSASDHPSASGDASHDQELDASSESPSMEEETSASGPASVVQVINTENGSILRLEEPSNSPSDAKRPRKTNFTSQETIVLLREFSARREILLDQRKTVRVNIAKQKAWLEVTRAVNAVSPVERSEPEVKKKWEKLKEDQLLGKQSPPDGASKAADMPELDLDLIRRMSASERPSASGVAPPDQELDASSESRSMKEETSASGPASVVQVITTDYDSILRLVEPLSGSMSSARTGGSLSQTGSAQSTSSIPEAASRLTLTHETRTTPAQECVHTNRKSDISDAELRRLEIHRKEYEKQRAKAELKAQELEIAKKEFEKQRAKAALRVQELEIKKQLAELVKIQDELKHTAEIRDLEKKKLQLEIQLLMKKTGEDG